jgi:hypothetical protein
VPIAEPVKLSRPLLVRSRAPSTVSLIVAAVGLLAFAIASRLRFDGELGRWLSLFACPFRAATGLPCLGCGATHAFVHLAHGHPIDAIAANPLWALIAAILAAHTLFTIARVAGLRWTLALPDFSSSALRRARFILAAAAAANWAFVALRS